MDKIKHILIVGAGRGIGKSLLENLSKQPNYFVIGLSRSGDTDKSVLISGKNYQMDLTNPNIDLDFLLNWKSIDVIYFTMGNGLFKSIQDISLEELNYHFQLNLVSPFIILSKSFPIIKKSNNSLICFLSSSAGKLGFPSSSAYCASKHGIAGLAKSLREEWKSFGIRIFIVYAGAIFTEIWEGREGFNKDDMISVNAFANFLESFLNLDPMINLDDVTVFPPKGIL